jgi:hypothetical protein
MTYIEQAHTNVRAAPAALFGNGLKAASVAADQR